MRALPTGLRTRLLVAFVLATSAGAALASWAGFVTARSALVGDAQGQAIDALRQRVTAVAPYLSCPPSQLTLDRLREVVGDNALITYGTMQSGAGDHLELIDAELRAATAERDHMVLQRVRTAAGVPKLALGMPILITEVNGDQRRSGVEVFSVVDLSETQARIDATGRSAIMTSALALPVAVLAALLAARGVLRPVRELRGAARRFADGDLSARVRPRGYDELADLARTVNEMAAELERSIGRLRRSEAESRRFVADVSHELRTPLSALSAVVDVLEEDSEHLTEDQRTSARLISEATRRLTGLVADLIEVSRFDATAERLHPERVDIPTALHATLRARGWTDQVSIDAPESIAAEVDPRRLDVVVANLVGNALRHGAPPVVIAVRGTDAEVVITVTDHGPGLPGDDPNRVFDRFYKGDPARSRSQGSGLGLAIAREHIRLHGGDLTAENLPGVGARFTARFPRWAAQNPGEQP
ncbi:HAMP domain-containing sensor histidine kinase [Nocardia sp. CDC153]|uniref:HAMP domain-containing sensor histidine kinase n=1 Tax=Nocardia sp. CDC153 TaxID=3112167 RepID=UPI002DBE5442|nr:HAMP domain-containing sensor histidine kinase [Nocardia sp. CDC153]MEC3953691.1 HAMP domain-containing sensor histidine kinase [Nocardia sp. CDC153]